MIAAQPCAKFVVTFGRLLCGLTTSTELIVEHPLRAKTPLGSTFVLKKLVTLVSVVIIAGTSNDQLKPKEGLLIVYIASALADGPNASTDEIKRIETHNLSLEFIGLSVGTAR